MPSNSSGGRSRTALRERDRVVDARHADAMHAEVELDVHADGPVGMRAAAAMSSTRAQ